MSRADALAAIAVVWIAVPFLGFLWTRAVMLTIELFSDGEKDDDSQD